MELSTKHSTPEKIYTLKGSKIKQNLHSVTNRFTGNIKKTYSEKPKESQKEVPAGKEKPERI